MIFFGFLDFCRVSFLICRCGLLSPKKENAVFCGLFLQENAVFFVGYFYRKTQLLTLLLWTFILLYGRTRLFALVLFCRGGVCPPLYSSVVFNLASLICIPFHVVLSLYFLCRQKVPKNSAQSFEIRSKLLLMSCKQHHSSASRSSLLS